MAHPDLDELVNSLLPFAQQMLAKRGEFFPFGACMKSDGTIELLAGQTDSDQPPSQEVIDVIADGMRGKASAGEIRAAGICYDVRVSPRELSDSMDAICVSLDHSSAQAVDVFLPYRRRRFRGPKYSELSAAPGSILLFPAAQEGAG
jgi:hypothetical protein